MLQRVYAKTLLPLAAPLSGSDLAKASSQADELGTQAEGARREGVEYRS
jgi:hypothetical protein